MEKKSNTETAQTRVERFLNPSYIGGEKPLIQNFRIKIATVQELKQLNHKCVRASMLDALEQTVWLNYEVFSVIRSRSMIQHEFTDCLTVKLYSGEDITIESKEGTFVLEDPVLIKKYSGNEKK